MNFFARNNALCLAKIKGTSIGDHLDFIRGAAALAVVYCHLRVLFMHSVSPEIKLSITDRLFYLLGSYGRPAVMVFFVLSGWLISGGIVRGDRSGVWRWRDYIVSRGTRLYCVLVPSLILTLLWDCLSIAVARHRIPNDDTALAIISNSVIRLHTDAITFFGNLLFLQTIFVPPLGSNTALWSLANEFWYYLVFPCLWFAVARSDRRWWQRALYALAGVAILFFTGRDIALYFPIWLLGTGLCLVPSTPADIWRRFGAGATVACGALFALALLLRGMGRLPDSYRSDVAIAIPFSLVLYCVLHQRRPASKPLYSRISQTLSGFSYTLYLVHLPLLIFLRACLTYETAWMPTGQHWLALGAIFLGVLAYAYLLSRLTEARTERLKHWLRKLIGSMDAIVAGSR